MKTDQILRDVRVGSETTGGSERIEIIDPETDRRWEQFVSAHPGAYLCHDAGWKTVLERSFRHIRGYYPVLIVDGAIVAALPLFHVRSWMTGDRLVSIPFATLCDPLAAPGASWQPLVDYAVRLSRELAVRRVEVKTFAAGWPGDRRDFGALGDFRLHVLQLLPDEGAMMKTFDRTCVVQKIHRAQKSGIGVKRGDTMADLRRFYELYAMTRRRVGVPPQPRRFFEALWEVFSANGMVSILLGYHGRTAVAGLMLYSAHRRVSAEYMGYDEAFLQMNPHHLLFWEAIRAASLDGCGHFDFGRTSVRNAGLMKFKGHWGTEARELPTWVSPAAAADRNATSDSSMKYRLMQQCCRRSPQFAVNALGRIAYRHLG